MTLTPLHAYAAGTQSMTYEVYASGIHVLETKLDVSEQNGTYNIVMNAGTYGFLAALVPWKGTFETHGWVQGKGTYAPELHKSSTLWEKELETKEYHYDRTKGFQSLTTIAKGKTKTETPDPALTKGTIDALTATLKALTSVAAGGKCEGESDVFDGKRRFTQIFHPQKPETLTASRYNLFGGEAQVCTVEVVPKGGAWKKKPRGWLSIQEQGRKAGALPTMWSAKLNKDGPAVPVKIMIKTSYGTLFLHLVEYKDGDKITAVKK